MSHWEASEFENDKMLAYILATAFHETRRKPMQAVREGFCKTDSGSRRAVGDLYRRGIISRNYALPHPNGNSYYGRGLVQLTHGDNYKIVGREIGLGDRLYDTPDMALDVRYSVEILFIGMIDGLFTGHRLGRYVNDTTTDYENARRVVNGVDHWETIADYARQFEKCLEYTGA